jgi:hypothetical protein
VQFFGQHQEVTQVTEFHGFKIYIAASIINIRQLFMQRQQWRPLNDRIPLSSPHFPRSPNETELPME